MRTKKYVLDFELIPCKVWVWIGPKTEPMFKWLKKQKEFTDVDLSVCEKFVGSRGYCLDLGAYQVVWISEPFEEDPGLSVHELNHAVIGMMKHTGIEDEEFHCYALQYLVNKIK